MPESSSDSNEAIPSSGDQGNSTASSQASAGDEKQVEKPKKSVALKIASALSVVLWTVGFILPFILKKDNPFVWVSDTCLLTGFWPLMFYNKAGWTWLVFGILTAVAGFGLELVQFLMPNVPESFWTPQRMPYRPWFMNMHHHVTDMHPSIPWILIGGASTIYGVFRVLKTIINWSIKLANRK